MQETDLAWVETRGEGAPGTCGSGFQGGLGGQDSARESQARCAAVVLGGLGENQSVLRRQDEEEVEAEGAVARMR